MIANGYTTHLYCNCEDCESSPIDAEFFGETWTQTTRKARKLGWRISSDRQRCYAPGHKIRRNSDQNDIDVAPIAGSYTTDLYCDCAECEDYPTSAQYVAENWSQTARQARKDGWRISQDRTRCFAPGHKIRRIED